MTLEEAIAEIEKLTAERGKLSYKKPTIVFGQGKYLDEAVRILERHQMTDIDKKTLAKCVRTLHESYDPYIYEVARDMAEEFGYTVEELLEQEPPRKPEWWEQSLPNLNGVLCWVSDHQHTPNSVIAAIICREGETGLFEVKSNKWRYRYATPLTDEEIESFKRGPKGDTKWYDVDIKADADCDLGELRTRHSALASGYRELNLAFKVLEVKFDAVVEDLNYKLESRENLIKKLVADNADLSQKRLELVADMQLLGEDK